jgi:integrator complex subunit 3
MPLEPFQKYERAFQTLQLSICGPNAKELNSVITSMFSLDNKQQEDIQVGFIYLMLCDAQMAVAALKDLLIVTRDGMDFIITNVSELVSGKFQKLAEIAKHQVRT